MSVLGRRRAGPAARTHRPRWLAPILLAALLAGGCDYPFEPFQENAVGPFSMFGYLDLNAETQWVRVMPIRQNIIADPAPIDAVVTLEHVASGRVVTLQDSLFTFTDSRLDGVGYAHNFWTTEPLEPEATYRLTAVRSGGAATTALVEMPPELSISLHYWAIPDGGGLREPRQVFVQGEHLLYTDLIYTVWNRRTDRRDAPFVERRRVTTTDDGRWQFEVRGTGAFQVLNQPPLVDMLRREARIAVAGSDWPYELGLSATDILFPDAIPSTVENGVGSVLGVATRTIPLPFCEPLEARPDGNEACTTAFDLSSASIVGTVTRDRCGDPMHLPAVRLTERYEGGGAVVWTWKTDWQGAYRFDGMEPGSDLLLEFGGHPDGALEIPPLDPGERYVVPDVTIPDSCM